MNGKVKILFFCMIFVGSCAFAQKIPQKQHEMDGWRYFNTASKNGRMINNSLNIASSFKKINNVQPVHITAVPFAVISPSFYTQNFGFFCRRELQLEKATGIPFKFRLGSVQQCDRMEGKPNTVIR